MCFVNIILCTRGKRIKKRNSLCNASVLRIRKRATPPPSLQDLFYLVQVGDGEHGLLRFTHLDQGSVLFVEQDLHALKWTSINQRYIMIWMVIIFFYQVPGPQKE